MQPDRVKYYPKKEETLNVLTHGIGLLLSIVALVLLVAKAYGKDEINYLVSFTVFGVSLVLLYAASTSYHYSQDPAIRAKLNIVDHAVIYILIAGTYTPFTLITLEGWIGWTIFGVVWSLAFIGLIFKLFYTGRFDRISTIAYVLMGWVIIFAIFPLAKQLDLYGLYWLFAGGILYTVGAVLYSLKNVKYNHAIFHVFVLLASFCHFIAVYAFV